MLLASILAEHDHTDFDPERISNSRLTVASPHKGEGRFKQQLAGTSRYGHVKVIVSPHSGIHCFRFAWAPIESALPLPFMRAACLDGVKQALNEPLEDGRQIVFVQVTVVDGSYHDVDTDQHSLAVAAFLVRDALKRATLITV